MDRYWLITWTCYGTWLPGNARGFVSYVEDDKGNRVIHNIPGTPYDADIPKLEKHARSIMKGLPVSLDKRDAEALIAQYQETSRIRGWELQAASVMFNHTHVVVGVPEDPEPAAILEALKSWATRAVKKHRSLPASGTFWTAKGSKRKRPDERSVCDAVIYVVRKQPNPLAVWFHSKWQPAIDEYDRVNHASASRTSASRTP
jgi:REP element-mobilizing transposase RayT